PAPVATGPLPQVPTLILEGQADLRTPLEDGQAVANQIGPSATVVAIPHTGHSVLGSDLSNCGTNAVTAFFGGQQPSACAPTLKLKAVAARVNPQREWPLRRPPFPRLRQG